MLDFNRTAVSHGGGWTIRLVHFDDSAGTRDVQLALDCFDLNAASVRLGFTTRSDFPELDVAAGSVGFRGFGVLDDGYIATVGRCPNSSCDVLDGYIPGGALRSNITFQIGNGDASAEVMQFDI